VIVCSAWPRRQANRRIRELKSLPVESGRHAAAVKAVLTWWQKICLNEYTARLGLAAKSLLHGADARRHARQTVLGIWGAAAGRRFPILLDVSASVCVLRVCPRPRGDVAARPPPSKKSRSEAARVTWPRSAACPRIPDLARGCAPWRLRVFRSTFVAKQGSVDGNLARDHRARLLAMVIATILGDRRPGIHGCFMSAARSSRRSRTRGRLCLIRPGILWD